MGTDSKIEWTGSTWNPVVGCSKVSPGCKNCYAERMALRQAHIEQASGRKRKYHKVISIYGKKKWLGNTFCDESALEIPLHWRKPRMIFVCSMSDLFHKSVPFEFIDKVFGTIELCQQHTFQILTKRPERMLEYFTSDRDERSEGINNAIEKFTGGHLAGHDMVEEFCKKKGITRKFRDWLNYNENIWVNRIWQKPSLWPAPHLWLGVTAENQEQADKRIPILLQIPAAVRFVSIEPMLGAVDIHVELVTDRHETFKPLDWVIVGGESGPGARYCSVGNIRSVVEQGKAANVPVFVKQIHMWKCKKCGRLHGLVYLGGWQCECGNDRFFKRILIKDINQFPKDLQVREMPDIAVKVD